jgi:hypothetical protein
MAAGVLLAVWALIQARAPLSPLASPGYQSVVPYLGSLLVLGGLAGLHSRQAGVYGRMGAAGFGVAFVGTLLGVLLGAQAALAGVFVEGRASAAVGILGGVASALAHIAAGFGLLLLGVATLRARALPLPWRVLPMATFLVEVPLKPLTVLLLGAGLRRELVLQQGPHAGVLQFLVWGVPEVIAGVCWALLGYALWSGTREDVRDAAPAG